MILQGGEDPYDAFSCRSFFAKEPRKKGKINQRTCSTSRGVHWNYQEGSIILIHFPLLCMGFEYTPLFEQSWLLWSDPVERGNRALKRSVAARPELFCGKWHVQKRHPMGLRHPVSYIWWHYIGASYKSIIANMKSSYSRWVPGVAHHKYNTLI